MLTGAIIVGAGVGNGVIHHSVGLSVGVSVGDGVGDGVGAAVGATEGALVGAVVGTAVGAAVGAVVGDDVVGLILGAAVGATVGSAVGAAVGADVGFVGALVGTDVVGACVGACVGGSGSAKQLQFDPQFVPPPVSARMRLFAGSSTKRWFHDTEAAQSYCPTQNFELMSRHWFRVPPLEIQKTCFSFAVPARHWACGPGLPYSTAGLLHPFSKTPTSAASQLTSFVEKQRSPQSLAHMPTSTMLWSFLSVVSYRSFCSGRLESHASMYAIVAEEGQDDWASAVCARTMRARPARATRGSAAAAAKAELTAATPPPPRLPGACVPSIASRLSPGRAGALFRLFFVCAWR
jgi:hypothetical protein